jgi:hypothetical protein
MTHKLIYLARRNPEVKAEDFGAVWRSHSELASTLGNDFSRHFTRVRQCIKAYEAETPAAYRNDYDGVAILTMKSWDALKAAASHPRAVTTMRNDELRVFAEHAANFTMAVEETFSRGTDAEGAALILLTKSAANASSAFDAVWQGYGERLAAVVDAYAAKAVRLNRVVQAPGPRFDFAGIVEIWFDNLDTALFAARNAHDALLRDVVSVIDPAATVSLLVRINFEKTPGAQLAALPTP